MLPNRTLVLVLIILYIQFHGLEGRGELTIRLVSFDNDYGLTYDGGCCDNWQARGWGCMQKCDYVMRVVISGLSRANDHVFLFHRPLMYNKNNIIFDDCPWATELSIPFDSWPGQVELSAYFYDYDDNDDTTLLVDWFDTRLRQESISTTFQHMAVIGSRRNYKTRLTFDWAINCAELSNCVRKDVKQFLHKLDYLDIRSEGGVSSAVASASEEKPQMSMSTQTVESTTTGEPMQIMTNTSTLPISSIGVWGRQKSDHPGTTGSPVDNIDIRPTSSWTTSLTRTYDAEKPDKDNTFSPSITSTYSPFKTTVEHLPGRNWKPTRYYSSSTRSSIQIKPIITEKPTMGRSTIWPRQRAPISSSQRPTPRQRWTQRTFNEHMKAGTPRSTTARTLVNETLENAVTVPSKASTTESYTKEGHPIFSSISTTARQYDNNKNKLISKNQTSTQRALHPGDIHANNTLVSTSKPQLLDTGQRSTAPANRHPNRNKNRHKVRLKPRQHWRLTKTGHELPNVETAPELPDYDDDDQMKEPGEWHGYHKIPGVIDPNLQHAIPSKNHTVMVPAKTAKTDISRIFESKLNKEMTTDDKGLKIISHSYYDQRFKGFQSASTLSRIPSTRLNPARPITAPPQDIKIHESDRQLIDSTKRPINRDKIVSKDTVRQNIGLAETPLTQNPLTNQSKSTHMPATVSGNHKNPFSKPKTEQTTRTTTNLQERPSTQGHPTPRSSYIPKNPFPTPVRVQTKNSNKPDNVAVDSSGISGDLRKYSTSTRSPYYTETENKVKLASSMTTENNVDVSTSRNTFNSRPLANHPLDDNKDFTDSFNTFNYFSDQDDGNGEDPDENFDQYFTDSSIPRFKTVKGVFSKNTRYNKNINTKSTTQQPSIIEKSTMGWFRKQTTRRYPLTDLVKGMFFSETTNAWKRTTKTYHEATTASPTSKSSSESLKPWYRAKDKGRTYDEVKLIRKGNPTILGTEKITKAETTTQSILRTEDSVGKTRSPDEVLQPVIPSVQPENVLSQTTNWRSKSLNSKGTKTYFPRESTRQRYTTRTPTLTPTLSTQHTDRSSTPSTTSKSSETMPTNQNKQQRVTSTAKHPSFATKSILRERGDYPIVRNNIATKPKVKSPYYKKGTSKVLIGTPSTRKPKDTDHLIPPLSEKTTKGNTKTTSEIASKYLTTQGTVIQSKTEQTRFWKHKPTTKKAATPTPTMQSTISQNPFQKHPSTTRRLWRNTWKPRLLDLDQPFNIHREESSMVTRFHVSTKGPKWYFKSTRISSDEINKLQSESITHPSVLSHPTTDYVREVSPKERNPWLKETKIKSDTPKAMVEDNKKYITTLNPKWSEADKEDLITATTTKYTSLDDQYNTVIDAIGNLWKQFAPGMDTSIESSDESTTTTLPWTRNTWKRFRPKQTTSSVEQTISQVPKTTDDAPTRGLKVSEIGTTEHRHIPQMSLPTTTKSNWTWRKSTTVKPVTTNDIQTSKAPPKYGSPGQKKKHKGRFTSTQTTPTDTMKKGVSVTNQPTTTQRTATKRTETTTVVTTKQTTSTERSKTTGSFWKIRVNDVKRKLSTRRPFTIKPFYTSRRNRFRPTISKTPRTITKTTPTRITTETSTIAATKQAGTLHTTPDPSKGFRILKTQNSSKLDKYPATTAAPASTVHPWTRNSWVRIKSRNSSELPSAVSTHFPSSHVTSIPSKLLTILKLSYTVEVSQPTKTITSSTSRPFNSPKSHSRNSRMPSTKDIRDDLKLIRSNEFFDDTKSTIEPGDIYDYFETSLFPSSKTTYREFKRLPIEEDFEFKMIPVVASNTKPGYGTEFPYLNPKPTTPNTSTLVSDNQKIVSTDKSNKDIESSEEIHELVSKSTIQNQHQVSSDSTTSALNSQTPPNHFANNNTNSTKNATMILSPNLRNRSSKSLFVTPEIPNSTKLDTTSGPTKRTTMSGSALLTTLIMPAATVNVTSIIPNVTTKIESTSEPMSSTLSSTPQLRHSSATILTTQTTVTSTIKGRQLSNVVPIKITQPLVSTASTKRPVYSTRHPNSIKVTLPDTISLHNGTAISARNGGKPDFVLNTNPVKKKRPPVKINAVAAGGGPTMDPPTPPPTPKWRDILPDLITLISVKIPVRTTPRAIGRKTISSSKPVSPASPVYQNADHNKRTKPLDFKTVIEKYWPAILGSFIGAVFLTAAILTSVLCKQQRIFLRRSRSRPQLRRSPASEQASSEQPEITESSSSASLCGDL